MFNMKWLLNKYIKYNVNILNINILYINILYINVHNINKNFIKIFFLFFNKYINQMIYIYNNFIIFNFFKLKIKVK
jgi:hypothetical protein